MSVYTLGKTIACISLLLLISPIHADEYTEESVYASTTLPNVDTSSYVNCGHVKRLLDADGSQFRLGRALAKCWHHGVTLDELTQGITSVSRRRNNEMYGYKDLYLPCQDVFKRNITKLTSRLLKDYLRCQTAGALDLKVQNVMERRFVDIIEVYTIGNLSAKIDVDTLISCRNASKKITMLCRHYGLTEDQWTRGFFRYYHHDKWVVEEDIADMSLTCDQIFNARLHEEVYEDPVEKFVRCQRTLPVEVEKRDVFEKKYARKLMEYRAVETGSPGADLRDYVSCRHLLPLHLERAAMSPSWYAYELCKSDGLTYDELQDGIQTRLDGVEDKIERNIEELYVSCETVFNEELWSFTTDLLNDYQSCREAGRVDRDDRTAIMKRFEKLFQLLANNKMPRNVNVTDHLVTCANFHGKLAELCIRRGSSLSQELRGIGSLASSLDDKWLNTEALDRLYVRCDDLFDDYIKFLDDLPVEQYMQCRWNEELSESSRKYIDEKIGKFYENRHKWNGTRYKGDADVEITSYILFD